LETITIILIGLSLSIDAFTLSLAYGLLNIPKSKIIFTSLSVGIFHFIMPLLGLAIGRVLTDMININSKYILIVVLLIILVSMIKSLKEEEQEHDLSFINILTFSFLVSLDSFSVGIGLTYITNKIFLGSIIFSIISCTFTYLGFTLGKYLSVKAEKHAKILGIVFITLLIIYFIFK